MIKQPVCNEAYRLLAFYNSNESSVSTHICKLPSRYKEPLNKSPTADDGSFPPILRFEKREIHTVFPRFSNLVLMKNLPPSTAADLIRTSIISHIQVVHRLQVKSMHSLIRVWFLNPFRLPSSQCEAYSQHLYKCQCCFVVDGFDRAFNFKESTV